MTELFALTYSSEATRDLLPAELDAILLDARMFNISEQVTGVLLYGDMRFFQLLEGPEASVRKVVDRVSLAQAHKGIRVLSQGPIAERSFESWHMGFIRPAGSCPAQAVPPLTPRARSIGAAHR